jgi:hypothetical protein
LEAETVEVGQRRVRHRKAYLSRYLTLREAATLLGMGGSRHDARRLARQIARRERRAETAIIQRDPGKRNAPGLVTVALLRHHFPELFDARAEAIGLVREELAGLREQQAESKARDKALAARIRAQDGVIEQLRTQRR